MKASECSIMWMRQRKSIKCLSYCSLLYTLHVKRKAIIFFLSRQFGYTEQFHIGVPETDIHGFIYPLSFLLFNITKDAPDENLVLSDPGNMFWDKIKIIKKITVRKRIPPGYCKVQNVIILRWLTRMSPFVRELSSILWFIVGLILQCIFGEFNELFCYITYIFNSIIAIRK